DERHVVAVHLAPQPVRDRRQRLQVVTVRGQQRDRLVVGQGGGITLRLAQGRGHLAGTRRRRCRRHIYRTRAGATSPVRSVLVGRCQSSRYFIPVTVDLGEVVAAVVRTADGVDGHEQVGPA